MTTLGLFPASDSRVRWLRFALCGAMFSGMLCCLSLWVSTREYPLVPILPHWLILPAGCGPWLLGITLASLAGAAWFFRPAILFFLIATLYLYGCDQNREQPWVYMYWVMLLLNFLPEPVALAACRLALSIIYLWAGIQKLNGSFFGQLPAWFVQPATNWGLPHSIVECLKFCVVITPFLEIFIAIGLWFRKVRWFAMAIAVILHIAALLFLGPIGHNVNRVIWPWNIAMVALIVVLFATKEPVSFGHALRELRRSLYGSLVIGLYGLLPIFSFFGLWDSYLSFALYSYNVANAEIYVSPSFVGHLPPELRAYVYPVKNYNPALQLPYMFEYSMWAEANIGVPQVPEPRAYLVLFRHIAAYAPNDDGCSMVLETRTGTILLYRAGVPKPDVLKE
jgi:uncharacterized membrane protein YphA (DoxX/SURF4 family)